MLLITGASAKAEAVRIATGQDFIPFEYVDESGRPAGLVVDFWRLWSEKTGIAVEFMPAPWSQTLEMVRTGEADIHAGLNMTEERKTFLDYASPLLSTNSYLFTPKGLAFSGAFADLSGFKIGVLEGSLEHALVQERIPGAQVVAYQGIDSLYQAVAGDKVRFFADVEQTGRYFLRKHQQAGRFGFDAASPLDENHLFAAVTKGKADLLQKVNAGLNKITAVERAGILRKWLQPVDAQGTDTLVVAVPRNHPPFSQIDVSGDPAGMLVDLWRLWSSKAGRKIRFKYSNWADTVYAVRSGEADIHAGLFRNAGDESWAEYSAPLYEISSGLFHRTGEAPPDNLDGIRVGAVFGHFQEAFLKQHHPGASIVAYGDDAEMMRALVDGKIDAFFSQDPTVDSLLGSMGLRGRISSKPNTVVRNDLLIAVRRGEAKLLQDIEQGMASITVGEMAEIERRWIKDADQQQYTNAGDDPSQSLGAFRKSMQSSVLALPGNQGVKLSPAEGAWIKANPRIRVHNETDWPPFNFAVEGRPQGYSIDFMNLVAGNVGLQVDYVTGPSWGEFLQMMRSGGLDAMLNIVNTQERRTYLKFTRPYADNPNTILSRKDAPYDSLEKLFGKTISVPKGFFYEEILKREYPEIKLHLVKGTLETMKAVAFGKADAALGELAVFNHLLGEHLMTGLAVSGEVKMGNPEYALLNMASRKDTPILASILDKGIRSITIEQIRSIQRKWLGEARVTKGRSKTVELTEAEKAWLAAHRDIRLGVDPNYPPFEFRAADASLSGMSSDYLALVNERLGTNIKVVPGLSWPEVISGARNGDIDVLSAAIRSPGRQKFLLFTKPHLKFPTVILTRDDYPFVANLNDLAGKKVAMVPDFAVTDFIRKDYSQLVPHMVEGPLQALQSVSTGEAQAAVINLAVATNLIRQSNITNIKVAAPAGLDIEGLSFAVRKDWPELVGILEKALASITPEEESAIRNKWIAVRYEHVADTWALVKVALQVGGVAVAILLIIVVWNRRLRREIVRHQATQLELAEQKALLDAVFENMDQGVILFDHNMNVIAFNEQERQHMQLPGDVLFTGARYDDMARYNKNRGDPGTGLSPSQIEERWKDIKEGQRVLFEYVRFDGAVNEVRRHLVPGGGVIQTTTDITERKRAEEELAEQKALLDAVFENMEQGVVLYDPDLTVTAFNEQARRHMRFPAEVLFAGASLMDMDKYVGSRGDPGTGESERQSEQRWRDLKKGQSHSLEFTHSDGSVIEIRRRSVPDGGFVVTHTDITERKRVETELKQAEAALRDSQRWLQSLMANTPTPISIKLLDGTYVLVNRALEERMGVASEELSNTRAQDIYPATFVEKLAAQENIVIKNKRPMEFEIEAAASDGAPQFFLALRFPIFDEDNELVGIGAVHTDITERKRAAEIHAENERLFRLALDNMPGGLAVIDRESRFVVVNNWIRDRLGVPFELLDRGRPIEEMLRLLASQGAYGPGGVDYLVQERYELLRSREATSSEITLPSGLQLQLDRQPLDDGGTAIVFIDVTERNKSEAELQKSRALLIDAIESTSDGFSLFDAENRLIICNTPFKELYHYADADLEGAPNAKDLLGLDIQRGVVDKNSGGVEITRQRQERFGQGEDIVDLPLTDGTWLQIHSHRTSDGGTVTFHMDITERKRAEARIAAKEAQLRAALEHMSGAFFMVDKDLRLEVFNENFKIYAEVPEDYVRAGAPLQDILRLRAERGDFGPGDPEALLQERIRTYEEHDFGQSVDATPSGRIVELLRTPAEDGGTVALINDVTERIRAEEELKAAKEEAEAVAQAKSDFIAVVSHEVRTPMNGVLGMARLMLETPLNGEQSEYAQTIVESGEGLLTILNDLLDISKLEAGKLEIESFAFAPGRLITETGNVMRPRAVEKGVKFNVSVGENVPEAVIGDGNRLRQIIFNLLSNATKFTDRGEIELSVESRIVESDLVELAIRVRVSVIKTFGTCDPVSKGRIWLI